MDTLTTCPRGHALAENAVYCTVCWIRVEPEDPERVAARRKRRRRLIVGIPLLGAGSIILGVAVGGVLANAGRDPVASVAAQPPTAVASTANVPESAEQPAAVVAAPLAATVAEPVETPAASGCVAVVREEEVPCTVTESRLAFTVCVPAATTLIRAGTRPNDNVVFEETASAVAFGGPSGCQPGDITADVAIDSYSPEATWRIVGRDASDKKIWKSRVVTQPASP